MVSENEQKVYTKAETLLIAKQFLLEQLDTEKFIIESNRIADAGIIDIVVYNNETKLPQVMVMAQESSLNLDDDNIQLDDPLFKILEKTNEQLNKIYERELHVIKMVFAGPKYFLKGVKDNKISNLGLDYNPVPTEKVKEQYYSKAQANELMYTFLVNNLDLDTFEIKKDVESEVGIIDCVVYNKKTKLPHLISMAEAGILNPSYGGIKANEELFGVLSAKNLLLNAEYGRELHLIKMVIKGAYLFSRGIKDDDNANINLDYNPTPEEDLDLNKLNLKVGKKPVKKGKKTSKYVEESEEDEEDDENDEDEEDDEDDDDEDDDDEDDDEDDNDDGEEEDDDEDEEEEEEEDEEEDEEEEEPVRRRKPSKRR